jgi:hypothetical protein
MIARSLGAEYDETMKASLSEVVSRAGEFFMGKSPIHAAAARIAQVLSEMNIAFSIAGALAANVHGHVRTTEDVDILLRPEDLARFKERWLGRGWVEQFPGSRGLRDTVCQVNVDVLLTGDYPGDGMPKPVAFPDPSEANEPDPEGIPVLTLKSLLTLKLASGMTAVHRPRDLDDVIQLIRKNQLEQDYAERLDPYVQEKYRELWEAAQVRDEY